MATCAACLRPIVSAQQLAIDETEVFHRTCVRDAYRSKLRITEQRVQDLERQLAATRSAAARADSDAHQLRNDTANSRAVAVQALAQLGHVRGALEVSEQRLEATRAELQGSRNRALALERELVARVPATGGEISPGDDRDDSEVRFSLLEIDGDQTKT